MPKSITYVKLRPQKPESSPERFQSTDGWKSLDDFR